MLLASGQLKLSRLGTKENLVLVAFSTLFTLNIAISNVSLSVYNLPFQECLTNAATVPLYPYLSTKSCDLPALLRPSSSIAQHMDGHTPATHTSR
jgi:hypothetical protein